MNKTRTGAVLTATWLILLTQQTIAQTSQRYAYVGRTTLCRVAFDSPHSKEAGINEVLLTTKQQGVSITGIPRTQIPREYNNCERNPRLYTLQVRLRLEAESSVTISPGGELWLSCTHNSPLVNINPFYEEETQDDFLDDQMPIATWLDRECPKLGQ